MAPQEPPTSANPATDSNEERGESIMAKVARLFTIWMVINFVYARRYELKNYLAPVFGYDVVPLHTGKQGIVPAIVINGDTVSAGDDSINNIISRDSAGVDNDVKTQWPQTIWPLAQPNQNFSIEIYVNSFENISTDELLSGEIFTPELTVNNLSTGFIQAGKFEPVNKYLEIELDDTVRYQNGSLYAHVITRLHRAPALPGQVEAVQNQPEEEVAHAIMAITQYLPQRRIVKTKNLLTGEDDDSQDNGADEDLYETSDKGGKIIVPHVHPNMTLQLVDASGSINYAATAPVIRSYLQVSDRHHPLDPNAGFYFPVIFQNEFWNLKKDYLPIRGMKTIGLNLAISTTSFFKFQLVTTFSDGMRQQETNGMGSVTQFDELKRVLMETNIYLLIITVVVSLMHTLFEFLAFKNDISHWKTKKDNVGVSVRTIIANVVMQVIILLYLVDNNEETSYMILFSQGMGILVEAWKITKSVDIKFTAPPPSEGEKKTKTTNLYNLVWITDKHELSETEAKTQEYDSIAFKYLYICAVPLILAYAVYALIYLTHKSWYSFIISTLVGSVYAYGFLMLVPSIYINYRLKSVAHMPRKALVYKFLNTFIDDLFAWVVKMPLLHRLATLRDDVIFFVYLYQTWLYRVDYSRVNEFGQEGDEVKVDNAKDLSETSTESKKEI